MTMYMLSIRLVRFGKKHAPAFRMVVQEKHRAPSSKYVEKVGHYIPHQTPKILELNAERIQYWISKGAQPSDTVHNMLVSQGVIKDKKRGVTKITKKRAGKMAAKADAKKAKEAEAKEVAAAQAAEEAAAAQEVKEDAPAEDTKTEEKVDNDAAAEEQKEASKEEPAIEETLKEEAAS